MVEQWVPNLHLSRLRTLALGRPRAGEGHPSASPCTPPPARAPHPRTHWGQARALVHREVAVLVLLVGGDGVQLLGWLFMPGWGAGSLGAPSPCRCQWPWAEGRGGGRPGWGWAGLRRRQQALEWVGGPRWAGLLTAPGIASAASGVGSGTSRHCGPGADPRAAGGRGREAQAQHQRGGAGQGGVRRDHAPRSLAELGSWAPVGPRSRPSGSGGCLAAACGEQRDPRGHPLPSPAPPQPAP